MIIVLGPVVNIIGRTYVTIIFNEHENIHFDHEWNIHLSYENYEESSYNLILDLEATS